MMLLVVTVSAVMQLTFSGVPVMCVPDGHTYTFSTSPTSLPVITTQHSTSTTSHQQTIPTTLHPALSRSNHSNGLLSPRNMSLLPKRKRQHPDPPKRWKATQKFLKNIVTPEKKYRGNYLLHYLNHFREMFETYASIAIDQTSVSVKPVKKSKFVIHKENQYNLERNEVNLKTKLNGNLKRLPGINANSLRRAAFQRSQNFKHTAKRKLPFIDNILKSDADLINSNEVESSNICTAGVNKTCVFKRSAKFQPSENITKLVGLSVTNVPEYGYKSNVNSQSITTRTRSDSSSLTENKQTTTSSRESANVTKNEPRPPTGTKVRRHNKRSSRPRGELGHSSRRSRRPGRGKRRGRRIKGLSLWIDSKQVKIFSGESVMNFINKLPVQ